MGLTAIPMQPVDELPEYPLERDVRLPGNYFLKWETLRWLNSEFYLTADPVVGWYGVNLLFIAQHQTPIGTLPDNDRLLARLCRIPLEDWQDLVRRDPSPLHNWTRCRCDGAEVRLMHPVVLETIQDQLDRREKRDLGKKADAVRQRLNRLREGILASGLSPDEADDAALLERMDEWLVKHHRGKRYQPAYDRVFAVAIKEGWIS